MSALLSRRCVICPLTVLSRHFRASRLSCQSLSNHHYSFSSTVFVLDSNNVIVNSVKGNVDSTKVSTEKRNVDIQNDEKKVKIAACGDVDNDNDDDDEMEQEEMFVDAYDQFQYNGIREWGGPRRGGRLPEPTRYGDWERKGRCSDF